jgi:hypothetical protein
MLLVVNPYVSWLKKNTKQHPYTFPSLLTFSMGYNLSTSPIKYIAINVIKAHEIAIFAAK